MRKIILAIAGLFICTTILEAQNDTMYVMKAGVVLGKYNVKTQVDSIIFYKPQTTITTNPISIEYVSIPAGTFTMGSPTTEVNRGSDERQHQVTVTAFRMSKYEITNIQYATFLNIKGIGSNGLNAAGGYPTQPLIKTNSGGWNGGLQFINNHWECVVGYENYPVGNVPWFGAYEFANYLGVSLPTEAQWEYACRAGTTTPFNTGACLTNSMANYDWASPYNTCSNSNTIYPGKTQPVGSYPANAYGLYDMHGNAWEWCFDWYEYYYPTASQTNPTGAATGTSHVVRGGGYYYGAVECRSANRDSASPTYNYYYVGFRLVDKP